MNKRTSQLPGFYKVTVSERRKLVADATGVEASEIARALDRGGLDAETADKFVENVLGTYGLPYGVTLNVRVNGQDHVVHVLRRDTFAEVGRIGAGGRLPGHFHAVGAIAVDSGGSLITGEALEGKRVQKFLVK